MKRRFTTYSIWLFASLFAFSPQGALWTANSLFAQEHADKAPDGPTPPGTKYDDQEQRVLTLWDLEFSYDASTESEQAALSNGVHFEDQFWVCEWSSDTIVSLDNDGNLTGVFTIPNLVGTRSMTWDGTSIWAANNTDAIIQVDPVTQSVVSQIFSQAGENLRFATYDETADGGNGGFWCGNFNTSLFLIGMDGSVLAEILADDHTLGGMYGAAFDNISPGGPYMWVFHQAGDPTDALITQLQMPTGIPTGVGRDVEQDLGTTGALAGGIFITDTWDPNGGLILGGVTQTTPDFLFGYDLDFQPGPVINLATGDILGPETSCYFTDSENIEVRIENTGAVDIADFDISLFVNDALIVTEVFPGTLSAGNSADYTFDAVVDLSQQGAYFIDVVVEAPGDINNSDNPGSGVIPSREVGYPPVDENFNLYEDGTVIFIELYNRGVIPFGVLTGATGSSQTGPSGDVDGNGRYIYSETSGRNPGDQAILVTNCLDLTTVSSMQFAFSYHAYGNGIEYLRVDVLEEDGSVTDLLIQVGQLQEAETDAWELVFLDLADFLGQEIEIQFTVEINDDGDAFRCDVGLDNILLVGCPEADIVADITDASMNDPGSIDITVSGATAPFVYNWSNGDDTEDITDIGGGEYTVTITDAKNCTTVASFTVAGPSAANEIAGLNEWALAPNPTGSGVWFGLNTTLELDGRVSLFNNLGQEVALFFDGPIPLEGEYLDLSDFSPGVYVFRILVDGKQATKKLVIQR